MVDPIKGQSGKKKRRSGPGIFKFNNDCPVQTKVAKPIVEFRPLPTVDPETEQVRPGVEDGGTQTFVKFMWGVNYAGMVFPHPKKPGWTSRAQSAFWTVPSDVLTYVGDEADQFSGDDWVEFILQNSPYNLLYASLGQGLEDDVSLPGEWNALFDEQIWESAAEVPDGKIYSPPLPVPEEHALMQAQLLTLGDEMYNETAYDDPEKSDGSLHPVVLEFKKSATNHIKNLLWGDDPDPQPLTGEIVDPEMGQVLVVCKKKIEDGDFQGTIHRIGFKNYQKSVDPDEIIREWHPWKKAAPVGGETREPVLRSMTAEEQVALLVKLYSPQVVDYALSGTPYGDLIPESARGSFKEMQDSGQSWMTLAYKHVVGGLDQGVKKQQQPAGLPPSQKSEGKRASRASGDDVRSFITKAKDSATPGGADPEEKSAVKKSLDETVGGNDEESSEEAQGESSDDEGGFDVPNGEIPF